MTTLDTRPADLDEIRSLARPLATPADLDPLLERVGDARFVLLGEASHGTAEFYAWRAEITKRLVAERGFAFVGVEGDWPDCYRVNRWVKGRGDRDLSAAQVLDRFERWPTWMWANREVAAFATWLRDHNATEGTNAGFYGLDVYSLWESLAAVLGYLRDSHPEAVEAAIAAYRCFEPYDEDPQRYAWATRLVPASCEDEVVRLLTALRQDPAGLDGDDPEAPLDARQNAEVVAEAERYYRTMVRADAQSWNVRDCHMADTLDRLVTHYGPRSKGVVWAHNTHVGDARATDMAAAGMVNVGQLVRQRHGGEGVVLVGFAGHRGSVVAAPAWGDPWRRMPVPPAPPGTHEDLLHQAVGEPALLVFPDGRDDGWLRSRRGHRAIGVVYEPGAERRGNWVPTVLGDRYDALLSFEGTDALHPLHPEDRPASGELETYPWSA
jgi:erythromycin esterase-like protein